MNPNQSRIHISLDLETLSTESTAAIVQIGAKQLYSDNTFCQYISPQSAERAGGTVSTETLEWWNKQDPTVRAVVMGGTRTHYEVLDSFDIWVHQLCDGDYDRVYLWSNGADFDLPILRNAYELYSSYPFNFRNHRCYRTLIAEFNMPRTKSQVAHNALSDAVAQAVDLEKVLDILAHNHQ